MPKSTPACRIKTLREVSKYGVFSGPYFPTSRLNTERYGVSLRTQSKFGKIRTRKNSVLRHFSHSESFIPVGNMNIEKSKGNKMNPSKKSVTT